MPISDNVRAVRLEEPSECVICEKSIASGVIAIRVSFKVSILIKKTTIEKFIHVPCAKELGALLGKWIAWAETAV